MKRMAKSRLSNPFINPRKKHIHEINNEGIWFYMSKRNRLYRRITVFVLITACFAMLLQGGVYADAAGNGPTVGYEREGAEQTAQRVELPENQLYAKSCALTDGSSGRLLYGKAETDPMANASTTKIMTCILALESGCGNDQVTASAKAAAQPKVHLGMKAGDQFRFMDLLYGLMLESYNDCAVAIAEHVAGSVEEFAKRMNEKAAELGCEDTHFVTPNGLDAEDEGGAHHTTAQDLCRIMQYCVWESEARETFLALTQAKSHTFSVADGRSYSLNNHNNLFYMMDHVLSGKTGYTSKAGYCYVAALEEGGRRYCIALLACGWPNNKNYKWSDAKKLFGYGMEHYGLYTVDSSALDVPGIQVGGGYKRGVLPEWGRRASLNLYIDKGAETMTFLKADWDEARVEKTYVRHAKLPVKKGDVMGQVKYVLGGKTLYTYDICAAEDIYAWDYGTFFRAVFMEFLGRSA